MTRPTVDFDSERPPTDPAMFALGALAMEMGCEEVEIDYLNHPDADRALFLRDGPRWWASTRLAGERIIVEHFDSPSAAADGLARRLLAARPCPHCARPVATAGPLEVVGLRNWCTWTRINNLWKGCA